MTKQFKDPFIWKGNEWHFVIADDSNSLFTPQEFGLSPTPFNTACRKGYIVQFRVIENTLYLDNLKLYCENNVYPPINNVNAKLYSGRSLRYQYWQEYKDINLKLNYSGTIIIERYILPYELDTLAPTFALKFEDGQLIKSREISGTYLESFYIIRGFICNLFRKISKSVSS